jgi:hypothetical protein
MLYRSRISRTLKNSGSASGLFLIGQGIHLRPTPRQVQRVSSSVIIDDITEKYIKFQPLQKCRNAYTTLSEIVNLISTRLA